MRLSFLYSNQEKQLLAFPFSYTHRGMGEILSILLKASPTSLQLAKRILFVNI